MSYIAGVIYGNRVYVAGDRRAYGGRDTVQKANPTEIGGHSYAVAVGGNTRVLNRVNAAVENMGRRVDQGDTNPPSGPSELAQEIADTVVESPLGEYSGVCLFGGYTSDEAPELACAVILDDSYDIESLVGEPNFIQLPPPSIRSDDEAKQRLRERQNEVWKEERGNVKPFLRRMGQWVAENDSEDACSRELDIVEVRKGDGSRGKVSG